MDRIDRVARRITSGPSKDEVDDFVSQAELLSGWLETVAMELDDGEIDMAAIDRNVRGFLSDLLSMDDATDRAGRALIEEVKRLSAVAEHERRRWSAELDRHVKQCREMARQARDLSKRMEALKEQTIRANP